MNKQNLLLSVFLLIIILPMISAMDSLGTFKQGSEVKLIQSCENTTYSNISQIIYPNSSYALNVETAMTKYLNNYAYPFSETSLTGTYIVSGHCDEYGIDYPFIYSFDVTTTGTQLTIAKSFSYTLIFIISLIVFIVLIWFGIGIPATNNRDEMTGYIIAVSNLKYVKYLLLALAYLTAMVIAYFAWMTCMAYLEFDFLTSIFKMLFYAEAIALLPLFILAVYILISNLIRDSQIADALQRGLRIKE